MPPPELEELDELLDALVLLDAAVLLEVVLPEHDAPQADMAWLTHVLSQLVLQQYVSIAHTAVTQASHPFVSLVPEVHGECEHVPPLDVLELLELAAVELELAAVELELLAVELAAPPEHDAPQADMASLTHCASHVLVQQ